MLRLPLAAALAALALVGGTVPADAAMVTTTFHYSGEFFGYLTAVYRPDVGGVSPTVGDVVDGVTKAECFFDATGTSQTGTHGTFVAKVVTTRATQRSGRPQDNLPVATGVTCSVDDDDTLFQWTAVRPGTAAYDVRVEDVGEIHRPRICVQAWILYSDGYEFPYPKVCRTP